MAKASSSAPVLWAPDTRVAVLHGPELGLRQDHRRALVATLKNAHGGVILSERDGQTATLAEVFDELRSYSLTGGHKLVVVFAAEAFVQTHRAALERYAAGAVDHATLLLEADGWRPGNLDKAIRKVGQIVRCDPLRAGDAAAWAVQRAQEHHGATLNRDAARTLVDRLGCDLLGLDAAIGRLAATAAKPGVAPRIDVALVQAGVEATSEEKAWAIQNQLLAGLGQGRPEAMLRAVRDLLDRSGQPEVLVMWAAADLCRKLAQAAELRAAGAGATEVNRALKLWGEGATAFGRVAARLEPARARELFSEALRLEGRAKRGLGQPRRLLEAFCVEVAA